MAFVLRTKICNFETNADRDVPSHVKKALAKMELVFSKLMPELNDMFLFECKIILPH